MFSLMLPSIVTLINVLKAVIFDWLKIYFSREKFRKLKWFNFQRRELFAIVVTQYDKECACKECISREYFSLFTEI